MCYFLLRQVWFGDLKEETESTYSIHTMKETTPLSKTGPFVYEGPFESQQTENSAQVPADTAATLDVSSPAAQYWHVILTTFSLRWELPPPNKSWQ